MKVTGTKIRYAADIILLQVDNHI